MQYRYLRQGASRILRFGVQLLGSATAYPVINSAAFYLDDFPSPVPSGNGKYIKRDYNMSIAEFYSQVWWPDLVRLAERYGIRFTGVMIENYGDDTKMIRYGRRTAHNSSITEDCCFGKTAKSGYHGTTSAVGVAEYGLW